MELVLFDSALDHLCRLLRLLRMQGGHALLLGRQGCGRRSLARLAAFMAGHALEVAGGEEDGQSGGGAQGWRHQLVRVLRRAGQQMQGTVLLVCERQLQQPLVMQVRAHALPPPLFVERCHSNLHIVVDIHGLACEDARLRAAARGLPSPAAEAGAAAAGGGSIAAGGSAVAAAERAEDNAAERPGGGLAAAGGGDRAPPAAAGGG